jgi:hypothetical protein
MTNDRRERIWRRAIRNVRPAAVLPVAAMLSACAPIPVAGYVQREIPDAALASIQPGTTTRADVLLLLADPTSRGEGDRHFVYSWSRSHGGLSIWAYPGGPLPVASTVGLSCHYLVVRFAPNGEVAQVRTFHGEAHVRSDTIASMGRAAPDICDTDVTLRRAIAEWLAAVPAPGQ